MNIRAPDFGLDNTYAQELEGFYVPWRAETAPKPELLIFNDTLAKELGLNPDMLKSKTGPVLLPPD